jgi:hypothetical protein
MKITSAVLCRNKTLSLIIRKMLRQNLLVKPKFAFRRDKDYADYFEAMLGEYSFNKGQSAGIEWLESSFAGLVRVACEASKEL